IVSLIFWSLIVVISIKYALLIMRADNHGEGGILALLALISPRRARQSRRRAVMVAIGLLGATLLYGDGAITPAISVLSAIEGLKVYAPQTEHVIVPLTVAILVLLFVVQRKGTSFIGGIFGPVMLVWFIAIGSLGIAGIARAPAILAALSPFPAITYLWNAGPVAFAVIGGAFLAVTGGEALYADMGHFGRLPIRVAWFGCALPALTLESPFYQLAPQWSHYGLVVLATLATVIASQAIITGAYSLTQQAIQLGFLPRMNVIHTAGHERGQIYIPFVNWMLAIATLAAVIGFGSSDALGGAYGIAVSLLLHQVCRRRLVPCADRSCSRVHHAHLAQGRGDDGQDSPGSSAPLQGAARAAQGRSAVANSGHGHRARAHDHWRTAVTDAEPQAQPRFAREGIIGRGDYHGDPAGRRRRARGGDADLGRVHARGVAVRVYGAARCAQGA